MNGANYKYHVLRHYLYQQKLAVAPSGKAEDSNDEVDDEICPLLVNLDYNSFFQSLENERNWKWTKF